MPGAESIRDLVTFIIDNRNFPWWNHVTCLDMGVGGGELEFSGNCSECVRMAWDSDIVSRLLVIVSPEHCLLHSEAARERAKAKFYRSPDS